MKTVMEGTVISVHNHTPIVEIVRKMSHPLYKKLLKRTKRYAVDPGGIEIQPGDRVVLKQVRPISKTKHFQIKTVLGRIKET